DDGGDRLEGGSGSDTLHGGADDDFLLGEEDGDTYAFDGANLGHDGVFESESDTGIDALDFSGFAASVTLDLGSTDDQVVSADNLTLTLADGLGIEDVTGSAFNDVIHGNSADNTIDGGAGDDEPHGGDGFDTLLGGAGSDQLFGDADGDNLFGGADNDLLCGGTGDDVLVGDQGSDTYRFDGSQLGHDTVIDGQSEEGEDILDFSGLAGGIRMALGLSTDQTVNSEHLTLTLFDPLGIEDVIGTNFADVVFGNDVDNVIRGGAGADELHGGGGADHLFGDAGNDKLFGDAGDDVLAGGSGDDEAHGGTGNDTYAFAGALLGHDHLFEAVGEGDADGFDFSGFAGQVHLDLSRADEQVVDPVHLSLTLTVPEAFEVVHGGPGDDVLIGGAGNDTLDGGPGNDTLIGKGGDDTLIGGEGDDNLI